MEIHRYEKLWFAASLLLIVAFIGTIAYGSVVAGISMIDDEGGTIDSENVRDHPKFEETGLREAEDSDSEYEASVIALQWYFEGASPLEVPANSEITFYVTSPDVIHGFQVVGTNINSMVIPGQISKFTVEFDEPGEYGLLCNEYCGPGHETMAGQIVVVPEDQWNESAMEAIDGGEN